MAEEDYTSDSDYGVSGALHTTFPIAMTLCAFFAIAFYNVIELIVIIATRFKRRHGLYFWSVVVATWGIFPYSLGFIFKFFQVISNNMVSITLVIVGWICMVTGQSVVMYSRLHLVVRNPRKIRWVLAMIIFSAVVGHIPIIIFAYGANSDNPSFWVPIYALYEKVQVTIFFLQETIIASLYALETYKLLKPAGNVRGKSTRKVMRDLIYVNILVIILDIALLGTEYSGHYEIQTSFKGALYSIKLKVEFKVLNQLISVTRAASENSNSNPRSHTVRMETFAGTTKSGAENANGQYGSSAFAESNKAQQPSNGVDPSAIHVAYSTHVTVEEQDSDKSDRDIEGRSHSPQNQWPINQKSGRQSPSSSEVQIVEASSGF